VICNSHAAKPSVHVPNDHLTRAYNSSAMAVDFSTSGVPLAPLLPPTPAVTSGRQTLRVHETAINYSLPRNTSGADTSMEAGSRIPTSRRPKAEAEDSIGGHYKPRDPVCNTTLFSDFFYKIVTWSHKLNKATAVWVYITTRRGRGRSYNINFERITFDWRCMAVLEHFSNGRICSWWDDFP